MFKKFKERTPEQIAYTTACYKSILKVHKAVLNTLDQMLNNPDNNDTDVKAIKAAITHHQDWVKHYEIHLNGGK